MRIKHLAFAFLAFLTAADTARAEGPLTDFINGSQVIVTVADVFQRNEKVAWFK